MVLAGCDWVSRNHVMASQIDLAKEMLYQSLSGREIPASDCDWVSRNHVIASQIDLANESLNH